VAELAPGEEAGRSGRTRSTKSATASVPAKASSSRERSSKAALVTGEGLITRAW